MARLVRGIKTFDLPAAVPELDSVTVHELLSLRLSVVLGLAKEFYALLNMTVTPNDVGPISVHREPRQAIGCS